MKKSPGILLALNPRAGSLALVRVLGTYAVRFGALRFTLGLHIRRSVRIEEAGDRFRNAPTSPR